MHRVVIGVLFVAQACSTFVNLDGLHNPTDGSVAETGSDAARDANGDTAMADAGVESDAPAPAINLVAHTMANFHGIGNTTSAIDTTGASLIVIAECTYSTGTPKVPVDSKSNAWQAGLGTYGTLAGAGSIKMFYAFGPTAGSNHTFTNSGNNDYTAIGVLAFSGTIPSAAVFDDATGSFETTGTQIQPGTITPKQLGELVVTFACSGDTKATSFAIDSAFTLVEHISDGVSEDIASGYRASALAAMNPTWTFTTDTHINGVIGGFLHP